MNTHSLIWHLFLVCFPTASASIRCWLYRTIKGLGCGLVRDGAYLLPNKNNHAALLAALTQQTIAEGGVAWLIDVVPRSANDNTAFQALFDRSNEYAELLAAITQARKALTSQIPAQIAKTLERLSKEKENIDRIDFFPNEVSLNAAAAWTDFTDAAKTHSGSTNGPALPSFLSRRPWSLACKKHFTRPWDVDSTVLIAGYGHKS